MHVTKRISVNAEKPQPITVMNKNTVFLSLVFLFIGFVSAYLIFAQEDKNHTEAPPGTAVNTSSVDKIASANNPFAVKDNDRLDTIETELESVKQKIDELEYALQNLPLSADPVLKTSATSPVISNRTASVFNRRIYNIDNLIRGGIDAGIAEDIVRRKNSVELKKLELNDRARREDYLGTKRYNDELETILLQDVDLRDELGDDLYDKYLFNSKQHNRIRIVSVMLGSAAEEAGIQKEDVVLSYDDKRMFTWRELKDATSEGQLGDYVSIDIYRDGQVYSFSVPRGPLGMQLGATRLEP